MADTGRPRRLGNDHELTENPYRLLEWRDHRFQPPVAPATSRQAPAAVECWRRVVAVPPIR